MENLQIHYTFKNKSLLKEALSHPRTGGREFERLEFLGDRVLGLVIADLLVQKHPQENEGDLAKRLSVLVSRPCLLKVAEKLGLSTHHYPAVKMKTDTIEAILGAIYLDGGLDSAFRMVSLLWADFLDAQTSPPQDAKTHLQEILQADKKELPCYRVIASEGPVHMPLFWMCLKLPTGQCVYASGKSKREAEQSAAERALQCLYSQNLDSFSNILQEAFDAFSEPIPAHLQNTFFDLKEENS
jgi:ribonuclease III